MSSVRDAAEEERKARLKAKYARYREKKRLEKYGDNPPQSRKVASTEEERKERRKAAVKRHYESHKEELKEKRAKYREENADKIKVANAQYREENAAKIAERNRKWTADNHERSAEVKAKYREGHREELAAAFRRYQATHPWISYHASATARGLELAIADEELQVLMSQPCHYCLKPGKPYVGIDRKDSDGGYTLENVVPCCWPCNNWKKRSPYEVFYQRTAHLRQLVVGREEDNKE